jgi:hypothetical protein
MIEDSRNACRWGIAVLVLLAITFGPYRSESADLTIELDSTELHQGEPLSGYFDVTGDLPPTFCNSIRFYGGCLSYELFSPDGSSRVIDCKAIQFCISGCGDGFRRCTAGVTLRVPLFLWFIDRQPLLESPGEYKLRIRIEHDDGEVAGEVDFAVVADPEYAALRDGIASLNARFFVQAFDAPVRVRAEKFVPFTPTSPYRDLVQVVVPFFSISGLGVGHVLNHGTVSSGDEPYPDHAATYDLGKLRAVAHRYAIISAYVERYKAARDGTSIPDVEAVRYVLSCN